MRMSTALERQDQPDGALPVMPLLPCPADVRRFETRGHEGPGTWIAYADHPGYAGFVSATSWRDRAGSLFTFARYFAVILAKRLISYELIPTHMRDLGSVRKALRFVRQGLSNALLRLTPGSSPYQARAGLPVSRALAADGLCVLKATPEHVARIAAAAQPLFDQLRQARGQAATGGRDFGESRSSALRTAHADLFAAMEAMLEEGGAMDGISGFLGHPASLVDVNPQINDASDDFWRRIFPDLAAEHPPTAYFHRDASGGDIKAIMYMSDVGPDNGPFSYAMGSHRARSSSLVDWVEETNDQSGFASTDPAARRRFAALPQVLRRKCAFGNDLLAGSEIAQRICGAEWSITAPRGHVVLFDTKGFHRGGMVSQGERLVLTCVIGSKKRRVKNTHGA